MIRQLLRVLNVAKSYARGGRLDEVLRRVSFSAGEGKTVCVVGPEGCGKSTLCRIIAGLEKPTWGKVLFRGEKIEGPRVEAIGIVPHDGIVCPWLNVRDNVEFGLPSADKEERVARSLKLMGLEHAEDRFPKELSAYEKVKVGIARALTREPSLLILDDPFRFLDDVMAARLKEDIARLQHEQNLTLLVATSNILEALELADRLVTLSPKPGEVTKVVDIPAEYKKDAAKLAKLREELIQLLKATAESCSKL